MILSNKFGVDSLEKADCSVTALANACDISYNEAYEIMRLAGRKPETGVWESTLIRGIMSAGHWEMQAFGTTENTTEVNKYWPFSYRQNKGITLKNALELMQEGSFVVNMSGHVVAVIDGEILDHSNYKEGTRVYNIFKLIEAK